MIEPISCNCGKRKLNFTGNGTNFKGANAASSSGMLLDGRNTRADYADAVTKADETKAQFVKSNETGTGALLNKVV